MFDFTGKSEEDLQARFAELRDDLDNCNSMEDLEARTAEMDAINAELENRRSLAEAKAEARAKVAAGEGNIVKKFEVKEEKREMFNIDSPEYRSVFLRTLMGQNVTPEERANTGMDAGTSSGGYAVPTKTLNKIIENMVQVAPMIGEVELMHIPGNVTIAVESTRNAAAIHTENTAITAQDDTLVKVQLGGYEIVKLVPISAKLDAMSIDAFETWIVNNLSRSIAELVENYIINGTGSSQPKGIDYSATWSDGTNAVDWASTAPTAAELIELMGLQNGAYIGNAKWLMNWKTFMTEVFALRDDKFEPVCRQEGGKYYVFGKPVIFSSKCADDDIFFGDYFECVKANFAQDITVEANKASGFRYNAIDYRGTCLFDCTTVAGRVVKGSANP